MIVFHYRRYILLPIRRRACAAPHPTPTPRRLHEDASLPSAAPTLLPTVAGHQRHLLPRSALIPLEAVRLGSLCHYRRLNGVITSLGVCLRFTGQACVVHGEPKRGAEAERGRT